LKPDTARATLRCVRTPRNGSRDRPRLWRATWRRRRRLGLGSSRPSSTDTALVSPSGRSRSSLPIPSPRSAATLPW